MSIDTGRDTTVTLPNVSIRVYIRIPGIDRPLLLRKRH